MTRIKISDLSIYNPVCKQEHNCFTENVNTRTGFGDSAMSFINEAKQKYEQVLQTYAEIKHYSTTTEARLKCGVMAAGLGSGILLSYKSKSVKVWYKRLIPITTLGIAAAVCYPYQAFALSSKMAKTTYNASIAAFYNSKRLINYISESYQQSKDEPAVLPPSNEIEEKVYMVGEQGIIKVDQENIEIKPKPSKETESSVLKLLPSSIENKKKIKTTEVSDHGQSSQEDVDLYTTR